MVYVYIVPRYLQYLCGIYMTVLRHGYALNSIHNLVTSTFILYLYNIKVTNINTTWVIVFVKYFPKKITQVQSAIFVKYCEICYCEKVTLQSVAKHTMAS